MYPGILLFLMGLGMFQAVRILKLTPFFKGLGYITCALGMAAGVYIILFGL